MAAAGPAAPVLSSERRALDHDDENSSSPLSEVDDGDDVDEASLDGMQLDHNSTRDEEEAAQDSDSDSNLSEDQGNDTEAETERLYDTPQARRQRDVVLNQYNEGQIFENTPRKLHKSYAVDDDGEDGDDESLSDRDDVSMVSSARDGTTSPTKPTKFTEESSAGRARESSESKKRKRSPTAHQSDSDQPLRKRTGSVGPTDLPEEEEEDAAAKADDEANKDDADNDEEDEEPLSTHADSGDHSGTEDNTAAGITKEAKLEPLRESASPVKESRITKKITRNGSKQKSEDAEESGDRDADTHEEGIVDDEADHHGDETRGDAEAEDDAEIAARNAEERERKQAALVDWNELEAKFGLFREKLYKDRLERLETEEQSLQSDPPTHPEYLLMKQCIDERLKGRLKQINKEHDLAMEALDRVAVARRAQIWGQFYQGVREKREQFLEALNQEWYETQNARRSAHSVPEYGLHFSTNAAQRSRNAVAYNTEVSYLSGLAKHEGFPSVPPMQGASAAEVEEDFEAFKRSSRPRERSIMQPLEDYQAVSFGGSLGPIGEQFIKNTPWANPNHISHKLQNVPPLQSESGPSGGVLPPTVPVGSATTNTNATASKSQAGPSRATTNGQSIPQQQTPAATASAHDASPETLRTATVLTQGAAAAAAAAPKMKHTGSSLGVGRGSKAAQETSKAEAAMAAVS